MDRSNSVPTAITFIIFIALCIGGYFLIKNVVNGDQAAAQVNASKEIGELPNILIGIDGKRFTAITDVSYAAQNFLSNTPVSIEMSNEEGSYEKGCTYLKYSGDAVRAKKVRKGDVLIYGDSCIIIATEDFKGSSKYKKVAHIIDMDNFPVGKFTVSFSSTR